MKNLEEDKWISSLYRIHSIVIFCTLFIALYACLPAPPLPTTPTTTDLVEVGQGSGDRRGGWNRHGDGDSGTVGGMGVEGQGQVVEQDGWGQVGSLHTPAASFACLPGCLLPPTCNHPHAMPVPFLPAAPTTPSAPSHASHCSLPPPSLPPPCIPYYLPALPTCTTLCCPHYTFPCISLPCSSLLVPSTLTYPTCPTTPCLPYLPASLP